MSFLFQIFVFLLIVYINAANYTVRIMNDSNIKFKNEQVHTWLAFYNASEIPAYYFSFESSDLYSTIKGIDTVGKCTAIDKIQKRIPSETYNMSISNEQYNKLIHESQKFCNSGKIYDPIPNNVQNLSFDPQEEYNCVTSSNWLLKLVNITFLQDAKTPNDVAKKIKNTTSVITSISIGAFDRVRNYIKEINRS